MIIGKLSVKCENDLLKNNVYCKVTKIYTIIIIIIIIIHSSVM